MVCYHDCMKKKTIKKYSTNGLVTKKDFNDGLTQTKKDIKDSERRLNKRMDRMLKYLDFRFKPLEEMSRDFFDFKSKIFDRLDWLIGRYQKFEDEYTVQAEQNKRILDKLDNHENRINTLEKSFKHN